MIDFTKYAGLLDKKYEELDPDSALRPTIINPSDQWRRKSTKSLMSEATSAQLTATELNDAKQATFELLDAGREVCCHHGDHYSQVACFSTAIGHGGAESVVMLTTAATVGILLRDSIENMELLAVLMVILMRRNKKSNKLALLFH